MKKSIISLTSLFAAAMLLAGCGTTSSYTIQAEGDQKSWGDAYDTLIASAKSDADATSGEDYGYGSCLPALCLY